MNTKQFKPCKKADQIGANNSTCCVRQATQDKLRSCVLPRCYYGQFWPCCGRLGIILVCGTFEVLQAGMQQYRVWVAAGMGTRVVQSQLFKFNTGYALRGTHGGTAEQQQPQDIPRCGWLAPGLASTTSLHCLPVYIGTCLVVFYFHHGIGCLEGGELWEEMEQRLPQVHDDPYIAFPPLLPLWAEERRDKLVILSFLIPRIYQSINILLSMRPVNKLQKAYSRRRTGGEISSDLYRT